MAPDPGSLDGSEEAVLQGRVTRVLFRNEAALFTAMKVKPPGEVPVTVVGELLTVSVGDEFTFTGRWEEHPRWGLQFHVLQAVPRLPRDPEAIVAYLAGGLFPGVGPRLARRVVERFGAETLEILFTAPTRLGEVRGIGPKTRARLAASIFARRHLHDLAFFLQAHGISLSMARKLDEKFGDQALAVVTRDPFRLVELPGIGFLTADKVARKVGLPADSPARIRAAVLYVLKERCELGGHSYLPCGELVRECLGFLNRDDVRPAITPEVVTGSVRELAATGSLVLRAANVVYLREAFVAETGLAERLRELARPPGTAPARLEAVLRSAEVEAGITYAAGQREAIRTVLTHPVVVLTGGPGTGKSTVIRGVLTSLRSLSGGDFVPLLAAPTGRAAKRLAQIVDIDSSTIHRLLEFSPETGAFLRDAGNLLEGDLLVVDEASMMDLFLSQALFRAVPSGMRVLLVGDADQLPPIGVGSVFADLIRSGAVPVVRLSHVFRQAEMSRIVTNAHRVNRGLLPLLDKTADFEFVPIEDETGVAEYVRSSALVLRTAGLSIFEINVLTPMRKTETGVAALNRLLQEALNPPAPRRREVVFGEAVLRAGDKVMQIRNNYGKNVFNGDLGVISEIRLASDEPESDEPGDDDGEDRIVVDFGEARVAYSRAEWEQLALAYATTIHKSQGSEYSGVVLIPVVREHRVMLQRNLLYTAITRARDCVVLVGQLQAIRHAVTNVRGRLRYSRLAERLMGS